MQHCVEPLIPSNLSDVDALIAIYKAAIEPSEQKPEAQLRELVQDPSYDIAVARSSLTGGIIGFSMSFVPVSATFWLLEYMAVDASVRSGGIGGSLFEAAVGRAKLASPGAPCLLEVDTPIPGDHGFEQKLRRLEFYIRHNCRRLVGLDYILPLEVEGVPPPMMLLVRDELGRRAWSKASVCGWLTTIYTDVYGCDPQDVRINRMLAGGGEAFDSA